MNGAYAASSGHPNEPHFSLYSSNVSPGTAGGGGPSSDPYVYNPPLTVNLSGKMGPSTNDLLYDGKNANAATSLISSVSSTVETISSGFTSARQVVFGQSQDSGQTSSATGAPSFPFFSLGYQKIINFAACITVGLFFMFLAFLFLPLVVLAPQKFTLLFTLGCLCWIAGLAMLQGTRTLLNAMMQKERMPFSFGYMASLVGTLYATLMAHSYILTLLCAIFQIVTLSAFIISYFPGGIRTLTFVKDIIFDKAKGLLGIRGGMPNILPI